MRIVTIKQIWYAANTEKDLSVSTPFSVATDGVDCKKFGWRAGRGISQVLVRLTVL